MAISRDEIDRIVNNTQSSNGAQSTQAAPNTATKNAVKSLIESVDKKKVAATLQRNMQVDRSRDKDAEVIQEYESIPNHNVLERALDKDKSQAYARKQELADDYSAARERKAQQLMTDKGISQDTLEGAFIDRYATTNEGLYNLGKNLSYLWNRVTDRKGINAAKDAIESAGLTDAETELLKYYRDRLAKQDHVQDAVEFADEHEVLGTLNAGASDKLAGSVFSAVGNLGAYLTGNPIDSESYWNHIGNKVDAMRQAASDELGTVGKGLYDVGTAVGDMVPQLALALATGGAAVPTIMAGATSFGDSTRDAASRGLTPTQIMGTGVANAAIEMALEKIPVDNFLNIVSKSGKEASKSLVKEIARQMGSEAFEEAGTEALTTIADRIINGDKSNFVLKKKNYIEQGMTEADATKRAYIDTAKGVAYSGLIGGLAGGATGGVAAAGRRLRALDPLNAFNTADTETTKSKMDSFLSGEKSTEEIAYANEKKRINTENSPEDIKNRVTVAQPASNMTPVATTHEASSNSPISADSITNSSQNINAAVESELPDGVHTHEQLKVMEEYKNSSNANIGVWAERKRTGQKAWKYLPVATVNDTVADLVMQKYGLDIHGNSVGLNNSSLNHIDNEHINNNSKSTMTNEDLERIGYVLEHPDDVALTDDVTPATKTKDNQFAPKIVIRKRIDGHYYVVEAVTDAATGQDVVVTAFIEEVGKETPEYAEMFKGAYHVPSALENSSPLANVQDAHENSSFDSSIPNSSKNVNVVGESSNQRVRGYNETLINKTDAPQEVKNEFIDNPDIYTQLSNETTLGRANDILANNDTSVAIAQYHTMLDKKDPVAVPLGYNLSKKLAQEGRLDESVQLVREMSNALTESGQFSQAAAITMLNNDPEAAKRYLIREIDTMNQKGKEKYGKKWTDFELTEEELKRFNDIKVGDAEGIKALYEDVYSRLRKEYPSTLKEKLLEYRRVAMLLNVRTNVRNVVSNALLTPLRWTADRVSALGEGVYSLIDPKYKRTQSINPIRSQNAKKLASEAFETVKTELLGDNKYEDSKGAIRDRQVFKGTKLSQMLDTVTNGAITKANQLMGKDVNPSLMETARNFTYWLLEKGDDVFVKKNFESRMASYIDAQGITDLENIPADAYTLATQEALKATFKDDSALANTMSSFRQMLNKAPGHFIGDAVMPFTKTPANIAMRGIDYSPAGVYNGVKTLKNAKNNVDIAKGLTQLGQAATGTAAIALGYILAESGILKGALSDDKDEAQFQKQQGELAYSIKTPFGNLTYDWAQPASIPLILGVTIYDSANNDKDFITGLKQGTLAAVDSWLELSPLQNLSDIFGGYGTPAENVWDVLSTDLPLSFLPAQMGAVAKINDTTQRSTYDQTSHWNNLLNQAKAKIPGLSETLPASYDTWGNPIQRQDNIWEAVLANLLNPGQFGNENVTPLDSEISRLYESTNEAGVFPRKAEWSANGVKLNNEQYSEYQRIIGRNAYDMVGSFMDSTVYSSLADDQRVNAIAQMYSFADALAKSEVAGLDIANHNDYKKAYAIYQDKGAKGVAEYYAINKVLDGSKTNDEKVSAVSASNLSDEEKGYYLMQLISNPSDIDEAIYNDRGGAALYQWRQFCTANGINGNSGKKRVSEALYSSGMSEADKQYFYAMFTGNDTGTTGNTSMTLERIAEIRNSIGK